MPCAELTGAREALAASLDYVSGIVRADKRPNFRLTEDPPPKRLRLETALGPLYIPDMEFEFPLFFLTHASGKGGRYIRGFLPS